MKRFMDEDFLLESGSARTLFHQHAEKMPLFDYHCHLSAREIAENKPFDSLGKLWLEHDHYKWRVMRSCAIPERLVTGSASWHDKYLAFAHALPYAVGNPVYHWTHLELQRFFSISQTLDVASAEEIWKSAQKTLSDGSFTPQNLITRSHVDTLCTTEDPADSLEWHLQLASSGFKTKVLPAWRPDKAIKIGESGYGAYLKELEKASHMRISGFESLLAALEKRMDDFAAAGCVASDHDVNRVWSRFATEQEADDIMKRRMNGEMPTPEEIEGYQGALFLHLAKEYARRGWVMEMHIGCNRNVNERMVREVGEAAGFDSTGDYAIAQPLGALLNRLEEHHQLPKTVLFCLNAKDNWILAALANTFQDDSVPSKVQFGTAWWMQDHIPGMRMQMETFATTGVLGHFIGMLSDSRSFLSYPRFEYFRRILCNFIGEQVESGQYPADMDFLGKMVEGVSYDNAKRYFMA